MPKMRLMFAGLCLLAAAAPGLAQRGQTDDRDGRYDQNDRYDRNDRNDRGDRNGRDDRHDRDDRSGYGRPGGNRLPGGSWAQSCRRADMAGNTLRAQCKDQRGKWRDAQISPRRCETGRVGNRFGTLVCE